MSTTRTLLTADWTVNDVAATYPATLRVFGRYGIDACCGGLKSLREVAAAHHFSLDQLLGDLEKAIDPGEVLVDVRPDLAAGQDPLQKILAAADTLASGGRLVLLAGFEPLPLYNVLGQHGFSHQSERDPDGTWRITFTRDA